MAVRSTLSAFATLSGCELAAFRRKAGLTQAQLARAAGIAAMR